MKGILFTLLLMFTACETTHNVQEYDEERITVSVQTDALILKSPTSSFGESTKETLYNSNKVNNVGMSLLDGVVTGYSNQVGNVDVIPPESDSQVQFIIKEIEVKKSLFTLNLPHPGPVYKMVMKVDVTEYGEVIESLVYRTKVNMSEINFAHLSFKWLTHEEKMNSEYQLKTFNTGLRKLYQKLYFNYFDISLRV